MKASSAATEALKEEGYDNEERRQKMITQVKKVTLLS